METDPLVSGRLFTQHSTLVKEMPASSYATSTTSISSSPSKLNGSVASAPATTNGDSQSVTTPGAAQTQKKTRFNIAIDAPIQEFKFFYEAMVHPAATLQIDVSGDTEIEDPAGTAKPSTPEKDETMVNHISVICDEVMTATANFESALGDVSMWKNEFLKQPLSPNVKLTFITIFSRLFRNHTGLHEPLFELVRLAKIYAPSWSDKHAALRQLEEEFLRQRRALDMAIHKMEYMNVLSEKNRRERVIFNWEGVVKRLLARNPSKNESFEEVVETPPVNEALVKPAEAPAETSTKSNEPNASTIPRLDKIMNSLQIALQRYVRQHFPRLYLCLYLDQHPIPKPQYLSVENRSIIFPKESFAPEQQLLLNDQLNSSHPRIKAGNRKRRAYSVINGTFWTDVINRRSLHSRTNSDGNLKEWVDKNAVLSRDIRDTSVPEWVKVLAHKRKSPTKELIQREKTFEDDAPGQNDDDIFAGATKIQESVQKFLRKSSKSAQRFDSIWTAQDDDLLKQLNPSETWFSLKDVMELILLHVKQMQLQQLQYGEELHALGDWINQPEVLQHEASGMIFPGVLFMTKCSIKEEPSMMFVKPKQVNFTEDASTRAGTAVSAAPGIPRPLSDFRKRSVGNHVGSQSQLTRPISKFTAQPQNPPTEEDLANDVFSRLHSFLTQKLSLKEERKKKLEEQEKRITEMRLMSSARLISSEVDSDNAIELFNPFGPGKTVGSLFGGPPTTASTSEKPKPKAYKPTVKIPSSGWGRGNISIMAERTKELKEDFAIIRPSTPSKSNSPTKEDEKQKESSEKLSDEDDKRPSKRHMRGYTIQ